MQYDHIGSLCLSFGDVGGLPKLGMASIMTKLRNAKDEVICPRWGGVQLEKYYQGC